MMRALNILLDALNRLCGVIYRMRRHFTALFCDVRINMRRFN